MSDISTITIAGSTIDLADIEYAVVVEHGRNDVTDAPQPGSAQIVLMQTGDTSIIPAISQALTVDAYGVDRFTGVITDLDIVHETGPTAAPVTRVTILATGSLSRLGLLAVGSAGYLEETVADRVDGILTETGLPYIANTDPMMVLLPVDPGEGTAALSLLGSLCAETGATMADLPNGAILFESYTRRGYDYNPATWAYVPGTYDTLPAVDWDNVYTVADAAPTPVTLPGTGVVWEPIWRNNVMSVINSVSVSYGTASPQDVVTDSDPASITTHGLRAVVLPTTLSDPVDAATRAGNLITAQSEPRWDLQQIQVRVELLDATTRAQVLALVSGDRVYLTNLPQPAPSTEYLGIVEGWAETYTVEGHTLVLSLSDPRYSYAMAEWIAVDPALTWAGVKPTIQWYDVVLPTDLAA